MALPGLDLLGVSQQPLGPSRLDVGQGTMMAQDSVGYDVCSTSLSCSMGMSEIPGASPRARHRCGASGRCTLPRTILRRKP